MIKYIFQRTIETNALIDYYTCVQLLQISQSFFCDSISILIAVYIEASPACLFVDQTPCRQLEVMHVLYYLNMSDIALNLYAAKLTICSNTLRKSTSFKFKVSKCVWKTISRGGRVLAHTQIFLMISQKVNVLLSYLSTRCHA